MHILGYIFFGLLLTTTAFAQVDSSDFSIRLFAGEDTEAPTTPTVLSVTPVATTQIDVVWSTATDNFIVNGYVVFRDGFPVATTTLTNFSDSGLTPSTTYSYFVQAFDGAGNYSSSSNMLATTTLSVPIVTPPEPGPGSQTGTASRVVLDDFQITRGTTTTTVSITTARPARFEIRFGRTTSYELGYSVAETFTREYRTVLSGLEPGTVYEYEVVGYSPFGVPTILRQGQFTTLGNEQLFAPENVTRLEAVADGSDAVLRWQLPQQSDVATVRVVRSHLGFPATIQDGAVVYQGQGTSFRDRSIFTLYSPVYYTVFVIDEDGRSSSGAVTLVYAIDQSDQGAIDDPEPESGSIAIPPVEEVPEIERLLPEFRMPFPEEIFVIQQNDVQTFGVPELKLSVTEPSIISIPKAAVAKNLKTIIATVTDPADGRKTFSFLLRINNTNTAYEATLAPLLTSGQSQLTITIYDYEARVVGTRSQVLTFIERRAEVPVVFWPDYVVTHSTEILVGWGGMLILFVCLWFWRRSQS